MLETPLGFGMPMIQCPEAMQYLEVDRTVDTLLETQPNPELREVRGTRNPVFATKLKDPLRCGVKKSFYF